MDQFPPLDKWFDVHLDVPNTHQYTRYDLCIRPDLTKDDIADLANELSLLIARLRLRPNEYQQWLVYWGNTTPVPDDWKRRFRDRFWRSFVSDEATETAGTIQFDNDALQGYIGELMLYLIQTRHYECRLRAVPKKPKEYSKDSGIDCLELCGLVDDPESLHYIVWESKGIDSRALESYPHKIYRQHLHQTPKSFAEMADQLADVYEREEDEIMTDFIDEMIDDFYSRPPSNKKCFGGCVSYSGRRSARSDAFSTFQTQFENELAEDIKCRQVRLCATGGLSTIVRLVQDGIWTKLLP